jgi:hypothetical protein
MIEDAEAGEKPAIATKVHVDGQYEYTNLEIAREAAHVACSAAARLKPGRYRAIDDDDWTEHPDRTD